MAVGAGNNLLQIPPASLAALAGLAVAVPTVILGAATTGKKMHHAELLS